MLPTALKQNQFPFAARSIKLDVKLNVHPRSLDGISRTDLTELIEYLISRPTRSREFRVHRGYFRRQRQPILAIAAKIGPICRNRAKWGTYLWHAIAMAESNANTHNGRWTSAKTSLSTFVSAWQRYLRIYREISRIDVAFRTGRPTRQQRFNRENNSRALAKECHGRNVRTTRRDIYLPNSVAQQRFQSLQRFTSYTCPRDSVFLARLRVGYHGSNDSVQMFNCAIVI